MKDGRVIVCEGETNGEGSGERRGRVGEEEVKESHGRKSSSGAELMERERDGGR